MIYVLRSGSRQQLGGKAFALAKLAAADLPIPPWFAVSPDAFLDSLTPEQKAALACGKIGNIRRALRELQPAEAVCDEINGGLQQISTGESAFAVRSSAGDEDSGERSFAGQLESYLFVSADDVPKRVADVWLSGFSDRVVAYRAEKGLSAIPQTAPAVLVQRMINADSAGVAFSADPVSGRRSTAVVSAVFGLGTALVSGESDADVYEIDRDGRLVRVQVATKDTRHVPSPGAPEGVRAIAVPPELQNVRVLDDQQVRAVADLARGASHHFGWPQDIEWVMEKGQLYLVQSRPITTLKGLPDPDGALNIWDNSNISESYSGITTPLTFSFARYIYEGVYREFCRILKVPNDKIAANEQTYRHMLGLVHGRVYYNLLNWYRVLALLPGFKLNRRFMEQMMGVREPLPENVDGVTGAATHSERVADALHLGHMLAGLVWNYWTLDRQTAHFYQRLNRALSEPNPTLADMRIDELAAHYHALEAELLTHWDAPLVNDFFAMIFHGMLRGLCHRWLSEGDTLANELVRGGGNMISLEPAQRVRHMATVASTDPQIVKALVKGSLEQAIDALRHKPDLYNAYFQYLDRFGDRCLEELKLESPTLRDDPTTLIRNIGQLASAPPASRPSGLHPVANSAAAKPLRRLRFHPIRRVVFSWALRNARSRVQNRENLRFERTRLFGRIRRIFLEIGKRLHSVDLLSEPRDVFYLQLEEILGFVEGTAATTNLKGLVELRKREFADYHQQSVPADRFETRGAVYLGNRFEAKHALNSEPVDGDERRGIGCCPGLVRGRVQVIRDPRTASLPVGTILVAERTDPGWIMLFPAAAALIVERGSLLSHSAIVSRELGIPSVVAVAGVTNWLRDGDMVEVDGSTGIVRRLAAEEARA